MEWIIRAKGGVEVRVSEKDWEYLVGYKWRVDHKGYVVRSAEAPRRGQKVLMHREILERMGVEMGGKLSDHKNGVRTDNRRENLRPATIWQNNQNRRGSRGQSGVKGVKWHEKDKRWEATIEAQGRVVWRKYFRTLEEAARARSAVLPLYHGEFARAE